MTAEGERKLADLVGLDRLPGLLTEVRERRSYAPGLAVDWYGHAHRELASSLATSSCSLAEYYAVLADVDWLWTQVPELHTVAMTSTGDEHVEMRANAARLAVENLAPLGAINPEVQVRCRQLLLEDLRDTAGLDAVAAAALADSALAFVKPAQKPGWLVFHSLEGGRAVLLAGAGYPTSPDDPGLPALMHSVAQALLRQRPPGPPVDGVPARPSPPPTPARPMRDRLQPDD